MVGAYVRVLEQISVAGQSQLVGGVVVTTDDRGMYPFSNLQPGKYVVMRIVGRQVKAEIEASRAQQP